MPKGKKSTKTTVKKPYEKNDPHFPSTPRNFRVGNDIQHKRSLGRFVKWPRYVRLQRQRKILYTRLKVPPTLNQFSRGVGKDQLRELASLFSGYKPLTKKQRFEARAAKATAGTEEPEKAAITTQFGLNHVTSLIEKKEAKIVCIAADVDPIELVLWLPALCRKMEVPYCIVRSKALLGEWVNQKTATAICLTSVNKADSTKLSKLVDMCKLSYNDNLEALKTWGGGRMGKKTQAKLRKRAEKKAA